MIIRCMTKKKKTFTHLLNQSPSPHHCLVFFAISSLIMKPTSMESGHALSNHLEAIIVPETLRSQGDWEEPALGWSWMAVY